MSYDLAFWKTSQKMNIPNHRIYEILSGGGHVDGLCEIPCGDIIKDMRQAFADWYIHGNEYEKMDGQYFEVTYTNQFFRVDSYGVTVDELNRIMDVLAKYGCPVYDASIDVRFDEWSQ
ncbi:MAG: hypothetical protein IKH28_09530 [Lachnospiraceae bacterium]|nr:hypothetical protein [Lachnospiraceae bacterium]